MHIIQVKLSFPSDSIAHLEYWGEEYNNWLPYKFIIFGKNLGLKKQSENEYFTKNDTIFYSDDEIITIEKQTGPRLILTWIYNK